MPNQLTAVNNFITNQSINSTQKKLYVHGNYKEYDFHKLTYSCNADDFINHNGLLFHGQVGDKYFTGNELLYYPDLARHVRDLDIYPKFSKSYEVAKSKKGMGFFRYFLNFIEKCSKDYESELEKLSRNFNELVKLHGESRYTPLITNINSVNVYNKARVRGVSVHGVEWGIISRYQNTDAIRNLDLLELLKIEHNHDTPQPSIEEAVLYTPFVALRIRATYNHRGRVQWYNLDTCEQVKKQDVLRWKKQNPIDELSYKDMFGL